VIDYLGTEDAVLLAEDASFVIRDLGLLAGPMARPQASAFGRDAYPGMAAKIAALIEAINRSHPLLDGNKRLSWICAVVFAMRNGMNLSAPQVEIDTVIRSVADGSLPLAGLEGWIAAHTD
jgi:death-on-curing protein